MFIHGYVMEKEWEFRKSRMEKKARNAWKWVKPHGSAVGAEADQTGGDRGMLGFFSRRSKKEILRNKAIRVLNDLMEHENEELRLKAAELVLRYSGGQA